MGIRVNTLGKSALVDRQLNSAYDVVQYVADNLPIIMNLTSTVEAIKAMNDVAHMENHIQDDSIHLTLNQTNDINKVTTLESNLNTITLGLETVRTNLLTLVASVNTHIENGTIHVTQEDKDRWNSAIRDMPDISGLSTIAYTGSYNDLHDTPSIDTALSTTSTNSVENRAITEALNTKVSKTGLARVATSGNYEHLTNKPIIDDVLSNTSTNAVQNKVLTDAITRLSSDSITRPMTRTEIEEIFE